MELENWECFNSEVARSELLTFVTSPIFIVYTYRPAIVKLNY